MINLLNDFISYLGAGNALSIFLFILGTFLGFYFYFKTFFRLTYSSARVCKFCKSINDWKNEDNILRSRILVYNNGRKTLTKKEVSHLEISSALKMIKNFRVIKGEGHLKPLAKDGKIILNFDYLDSGDAFVLEIEHSGEIQLKGRISETGRILETEPRTWFWVNLFTSLLLFALMSYNVFLMIDSDKLIVSTIINFILLVAIHFSIRFIHSLLFIPDRLESKYLDAQDKTNRAFKNEF